jgi:RNA polymerase sigma-70 factor (ECF subfamily)
MQQASRPTTETSNSLPKTTANGHAPDTAECITDERLITLIRSGDRKAFDTLIRRYERQINSLAYRLSGNYDDAQEVVSEAFLRISLNVHSVKHAVTLKAWINRIVVNVFINSRRHARRRPATSLDALHEKAGDLILNDERGNQFAPERHAEANERKMILNRAIASLPEFQRMLVTLFHHEGRTYEEISRALRIPIGTVKSRLNRARLALRELLTPYKTVVMH